MNAITMKRTLFLREWKSSYQPKIGWTYYYMFIRTGSIKTQSTKPLNLINTTIIDLTYYIYISLRISEYYLSLPIHSTGFNLCIVRIHNLGGTLFSMLELDRGIVEDRDLFAIDSVIQRNKLLPYLQHL